MGAVLSIVGAILAPSPTIPPAIDVKSPLPPDVRFEVFLAIARVCEEDDDDMIFETIKNLALTSKAWHTAFEEHRGLIYRNTLLLSMSDKNLRAARAASYCQITDLAEAKPLLMGVLRSVGNQVPDDKVLLPFNAWPESLVRRMRKNHAIVHSAARRMDELQQKDPGNEATISELDRMERAIYHASLFVWALMIRRKYVKWMLAQRWLPAAAYPEWAMSNEVFNDIFVRNFSVLKMEQIRCIIAMLLKDSTLAHNLWRLHLVDGGLVQGDLIESPDDDMVGYLMLTQFSTIWPFFAGDFVTIPLLSLGERLGDNIDWMEPLPFEYQNYPEDRQAAEAIWTLDLQSSQESLVNILNSRPAACPDNDAGPSRMWLHARRDLLDMNELECLLLGLRAVGYAFWDNDRATAALTQPLVIPDNIRAYNALHGTPGLYEMSDYNAVIQVSESPRLVLIGAGHSGAFDIAQFLVDGMFDEEPITELEQALRYHPPSSATCLGCRRSGRGHADVAIGRLTSTRMYNGSRWTEF